MTEAVGTSIQRSQILIIALTSHKKNLCCLLYGPGKARFESREVPALEDPHDILVRIAYVGVCGSDVSPFLSSYIPTPF